MPTSKGMKGALGRRKLDPDKGFPRYTGYVILCYCYVFIFASIIIIIIITVSLSCVLLLISRFLHTGYVISVH